MLQYQRSANDVDAGRPTHLKRCVAHEHLAFADEVLPNETVTGFGETDCLALLER